MTDVMEFPQIEMNGNGSGAVHLRLSEHSEPITLTSGGWLIGRSGSWAWVTDMQATEPQRLPGVLRLDVEQADGTVARCRWDLHGVEAIRVEANGTLRVLT